MEAQVIDAPPLTTGSRVTGIVGVVLGALLVVGTCWLGFGGGELGHASLTRADEVSQTIAPSLPWGAFTLVLAAALALLAGPRPHARISLTSIAGALWTLFWGGPSRSSARAGS